MLRHEPTASATLVYLRLSGVTAFVSSLVLTVLAVYYVTAVGMNPLQIVLAGTVFECAILICEVPTGVVADTYSRRLSIVVGTFILGAALLLEGALPLLAAVLLAEVIAGVGETFLSGATDAWLADEIGEAEVGQVYLRAAQIGRGARLAGIAAGAGLGSIWLSLPLLLGGALYLALGVFLALRMPERGFTPTPRDERASWRSAVGTFRAGMRVVRGRPMLLALLGVSLVAGAAGEGFDRLWEAHLLLGFTFPALGALQPVVWFGAVNVGTTLAALVVAALLGRRLDALSRDGRSAARALLVLNAVLVVSTVAFALAGSFALAVGALVVRAVATSLGDPLYRAWLVQQTSPSTRATLLSINSQAGALGETACGPAFGLLGTLFSLRVALAAAGVLLAPVAAIYARTLRHGPAEDDEQPLGTPADASTCSAYRLHR
jgi:DHA3 family tetracycline resistance protein-like MFS transporter